MVRRIHHHHGSEGTIGPCQCADPMALAPPDYPRRDRPPPTSYRDEDGRFHPGPGVDGYTAHLGLCGACWRGFVDARDRGEQWAVSLGLLRSLPMPTLQPGQGEAGARDERRSPVPMPIPGPGMPREQQALVLLRPQHIGPAAVVVGATSYLLAALLPWWFAAPALAGVLVLLVAVGRRVELDPMPQARLMRRGGHPPVRRQMGGWIVTERNYERRSQPRLVAQSLAVAGGLTSQVDCFPTAFPLRSGKAVTDDRDCFPGPSRAGK